MKRTTVPMLLLVFVTGACSLLKPGSNAPPEPKEFTPVGIYDFSAELDGTPFTGRITITGKSGDYGGMVTTNISDPAAISSVLVNGPVITVVATTPAGNATFQLNMSGNAFTGSWAQGSEAGTLTGSKQSP
jgi:hypothetical protein